MIDFSSVDRTGIAALVSPQYIVSVKHNGGYQQIKFGYSDDTTYTLVDRNNHWRDFHSPRLNKIVTETIPFDITSAGISNGTYQNSERFPVFYRVGTGTQYIKNGIGKSVYLSGAYSYKTGGIVNPPVISDWSFVNNVTNEPLSTYGTSGDSGSPLFAWDAQQNRWVIAAVLNAYAGIDGKTNWYTIIPAGDVNNSINQDADAPVVSKRNEGDIYWSYANTTGVGSLTQGSTSWAMHGNQGTTWPASLNSGKNLIFQGGGAILLKDSVNQGAGTLIFNDNFMVRPIDSQTWKGGGVIINDNYTLDWQVNGVNGDNLHKIGTGTLKVNGKGINSGGLNVGEGTVILAQRPDNDGNVQAFSSINIVSGRPIVFLNDDKQVDPDKVKWGYRGGKLDINGNNLSFHQLNGADDGAVLTNSGPLASVNLNFNKPDASVTVANIWHGYFTGNLDVNNDVTPGTHNDFIIDGGMNTQGAFTQNNGRLVMQGHPVVHAVSSQSVANILKTLGDNSVLTQPVSFNQSDWQSRGFRMKQLNLQNAAFDLGRNASLDTTINADGSIVTLGSEDVYIDLNDGNGVHTTPTQGKSKAMDEVNQSRFTGRVQLNNNSTLNINELFAGGIESRDSTIQVASTNAILDQFSHFMHSPLKLADGAKLTVTSGLFSDSEVVAGVGSSLSLISGQLGATYTAKQWVLAGNGTMLTTGAGTLLSGNIWGDNTANINIGKADGQEENLFTNYFGNMNAPQSSLTMRNTYWQAKGASTLKSVDLNGSQISFGNSGQTGALNVEALVTNNSQFIINTDGKTADMITVKKSLTGKNNMVVVVPATTSVNKIAFPLSIIKAPKATSDDVFLLKPITRRAGFHTFLPRLKVVETESSKQWLLEGMDVQQDKTLLQKSKSFMDTGYKNFLIEMKDLNYRTGDLRDMHGEAGTWASIRRSTSSGDEGYFGNWTSLLIGADSKQLFEGGNLFTGTIATFTNINNQGKGWSGKTKSIGTGIYASAVFDSGMYVDVISKYVHHDNIYSATDMLMPETQYSSHSWYTGVRTGWNISLPGDMFLEPQTEFVYGGISGKNFTWQADNYDISLQRKHVNPLFGRIGMKSGINFKINDWNVSVLVGAHYQYDLFDPGETVIKDFTGKTSINNGKASCVNFTSGINATIKDNSSISLNVERSAFSHYNHIDNVINANIRYSF